VHNVKPILGHANNPPLSTKIDAVLLLKTYHEVAQPIALLRNLRPSLTAGAKVGVIDRNGNGENHGVAREIVIREANEGGYELVEQDNFGQRWGWIIFWSLGRNSCFPTNVLIRMPCPVG